MLLLPSSLPVRRRARVAPAATSLLLLGLLLGLVPLAPVASAAPGAPAVERTASEVTVTVPLTAPLPVVDDVPVLLVDGEAYPATESADGLSLTADLPVGTDVAPADVEVGWSTGRDKTTPTDSPVTDLADRILPGSSRSTAGRADGSETGDFAYLQDDYDFGAQAIDLAHIGGIRGEMTGRIYLPTTGGRRPVVILLHGRHSYCAPVSGTERWPCPSPEMEIPSYKGYDGTGQTLATQGYAVVSVSANAINANDNQLAPDNGAQARGRLVLDVLEMLRRADAGETVTFHDEDADTDLTLDEALDETQSDLGTADLDELDAADLVGRFDLTNVGMMGHSRGGEGVVSAVTLNQAEDEPFGIRSVLPLAPVDFGRMTVPDTPMLVVLPYCDGDVANQQGQHFLDDSRYAHDDSVLRTGLWVMGANHNFFNTVWTPGGYPLSTSDDWGTASTDSVCGPLVPGNIRLSDSDQYDVGTAVMSAWFRLTLGGEDDFLPQYDGTGAVDGRTVLESLPDADLRVVAQVPAASRLDLATLTAADDTVTTSGSVTAATCASAGGRALPQELPACATANSDRSTSGMPHWTPASFAPNVPATPVLEATWTGLDGSLEVAVPEAARDLTAYDALTFRTAPEEDVADGTDLVVTLTDGAGDTWSAPVSDLNPLAVERMPASGSTTLDKIVLQQVTVPTASLTGIDATDVVSVSFAPAVGTDGTQAGGVYLADLALATSSVGTADPSGPRPVVDVATTDVEEADAGRTQAEVAVHLSAPADVPVTTWFTLLGSSGGSPAGLARELVTIEPGETCVRVPFPTAGDDAAGTSAVTTYKMSVSDNTGAPTGDSAVTLLRIREDDGVTGGTETLPVGVQGDACAELAALSEDLVLATSVPVAAPDEQVTVTATGYRVGEAVTFTDGTDGGAELAVVTADATGTAVLLFGSAELGTHDLAAVGAGSRRTSTVALPVVTPTTTVLALDPAAPEIGEAVTLAATVTGGTAGEQVDFTDGGTSIGSAPLTDGVATLALPDGLGAGEHELVASYAGTDTTGASASDPVALTLVRDATTAVLTLSPSTTRYGAGTTGTVVVDGATDGEVELSTGDFSTTLTLTDGRVDFPMPRSAAAGDYPLTARFAGSDTAEPSAPTTATWTVTRARTRTVVRRDRKRVPDRGVVTLDTLVRGLPAWQRDHGVLRVRVDGALERTVPVRDAARTIRVRLRGTGVKRIRVTYAGGRNYVGSADVVRVRVVR